MPARLYSYIVARDYGFAPNPFYGFCTLATCKPQIRKKGEIGDWIIGTGSKSKGRDGRLVYAMRVTEAMSFDDYWADSRFHRKRPDMHASMKKAFGDNIYYRDNDTSPWRQLDSHHSYDDGTQNDRNVRNDTQVNRVLVSNDFIYWGGNGPTVPTFWKKLSVTARKDIDAAFPARWLRTSLPGFVPSTRAATAASR